MISTNSNGTVPEELKVKAIHLSVRSEDANLVKAKFTKLIFANIVDLISSEVALCE
jgi:hypothetical protein